MAVEKWYEEKCRSLVFFHFVLHRVIDATVAGMCFCMSWAVRVRHSVISYYKFFGFFFVPSHFIRYAYVFVRFFLRAQRNKKTKTNILMARPGEWRNAFSAPNTHTQMNIRMPMKMFNATEQNWVMKIEESSRSDTLRQKYSKALTWPKNSTALGKFDTTISISNSFSMGQRARTRLYDAWIGKGIPRKQASNGCT